MVDDVKDKIALLRKEGYSYDWSRRIYYNREVKKVFSLEALGDHDMRWLKQHLKESSSSRWHFYFSLGPSEAVKNDLTQVLSGYAMS